MNLVEIHSYLRAFKFDIVRLHFRIVESYIFFKTQLLIYARIMTDVRECQRIKSR